jgi:hypothetical protein
MAMNDVQPSGISDPQDDSTALLIDAQPDGAGDGTFSIGPPQAVTNSRDLPAVSAAEEAVAVQTANADLGDQHPDNVVDDEGDLPAPEPDADAGEELPSEDELAAAVADVDADDVDDVGFDEADRQDPLDDMDALMARARMGGS